VRGAIAPSRVYSRVLLIGARKCLSLAAGQWRPWEWIAKVYLAPAELIESGYVVEVNAVSAAVFQCQDAAPHHLTLQSQTYKLRLRRPDILVDVPEAGWADGDAPARTAKRTKVAGCDPPI
jgi:hypothetical protein